LVKYGDRSPKFIWVPVYSCTHWLRPLNFPPPPHLGSYTRALLVSQERRHLFVTPCIFLHTLNRFSPSQTPSKIRQLITHSAILPIFCSETTGTIIQAGENSIQMSGSNLCIPRNETARPCYFQNIIIMFCLSIYTLMYL
jgi:hypothetical protein